MQNNDLKSVGRRSFLRDSIWVGAVALAYFLAHQLSFLFPDSAKVLMAVWPAAGIGLTALLLSPRYLWPAILVAVFVAGNAANLVAGRPFVNSVGFMAANVLESSACAWFITRWCGKTITFTRKKEVLVLICAATVVNACTAAIGACTAFAATGASFWSFWETWWVADGLGILLVVPFIVVWGTALKFHENVQWGRVFESGLFFAIWIMALWLSVQTKHTFHMLSPQPYLFFTLLAWCAFRFGQLGVSNALVVLAISVISSKTAFTWGVINQYDSLLLKQLYLGCIGITGYLLAASNIEQKQVAKELKASMVFLNTIIDKNPFPMWLSDRNGTLFQINKACCELMNITENEVVGKYNIFADAIIKEQGMFDKVKSVYDKGEIVRFELAYDSSRLKNFPLDKTVSRISDVTIFPIMDANGSVINAVIQHIDITDRKQAETALLKSEKRLHEAQKLAHIGVWDWKADTDTVIWTEELYHIAGLNPMLPAPAYNEQSNLYTSKSWELLKNGVQRAITTGEPYRIELELIRPDGSIRCVNAFGGAKYDDKGVVSGLFGTLQDITETKKVEDALLESEERYRNLFEKSQDALMTLEPPSYAFTSGNKVALEMFGAKSVREFIARRPVDLSPERQPDGMDSAQKVQEMIETALRQGSHFFEWTHKRINGGEFFANVLLTRIEFKGKPVLQATVRDITDRKMAEKEHLKLELQIQQTQKLESLGVLAGGIAHDFNNLMGGVFGYIGLASEASTENKVTGYLAKAMNTIGRARDLTQQLLTFAKGGDPVQQIGDLFPFVQETAQFALSGANVSCHFDVPQDLWACNFDKNQIGQVIDNLVINAQQAMPVGGAIELTARNISLAEKEHPLLATGNYVKISVKDSGIGIPKELIAKIFDPFFTTKEKGHGLGLATCYSIIKRHSGCIDVESESGRGSTFQVYLPASMESASSDNRKTAKTHKGSGTFLIMDDEEVIRDTIGDMLAALGYSVVSKENGKDAIEFFASSETEANRKIAGMIFDLTVPGGMGGKAAIEEIRKLDKNIPAFVASGYADDPVMKTPAEYGFMASICKPFRKSELSEMLNRYMKPKTLNRRTRKTSS